MLEFQTLVSQANAIRARAVKKQERNYSNTPQEIIHRLEQLK
jgi:hypothetical protein